MVAITQVLTFVTAVTAAVISPRDAAKVYGDLQTINTDNGKVKDAANKYNGGVANAIPIVNAASQLDKDIKAGTDDAKAAGQVSQADAQKIIDYINKTLEPGIVATLKALENKKAKFDSDGLTKTVHDQLVSLKKDTDGLGAALVADTPSSLKSQANAAQAKIDSDFDGAIKFFS